MKKIWHAEINLVVGTLEHLVEEKLYTTKERAFTWLKEMAHELSGKDLEEDGEETEEGKFWIFPDHVYYLTEKDVRD